jgi:hypothetical protein
MCTSSALRLPSAFGIDGSTYVVKARDGEVALADNPQIAGVVKASLSDGRVGSAMSRSF